MKREKIEELISKYDWYQRISLGDGLFTPAAGGDSQAKLELLQLPDSLAGKSVLDIGCNEGFFCFEADVPWRTTVVRYKPENQPFRGVSRIPSVQAVATQKAALCISGFTRTSGERVCSPLAPAEAMA